MKGWAACPTCRGRGVTTDVKGRPAKCQRRTLIYRQPATCIKCGRETWRRLSRTEGIHRECELEAVRL